ncbi:N-acetylmuramoyl-L-alanine amidase family protein [Clostridium sp. HBUAS56010]|uniref:N-acetylmuramoyl-L-alanine amidase family protein n=1 Tax=Clostridium sp. HBUAS56010 TaxID=2571127 RepID=UPI001177BAC2|nr:N-acetylmuramoyl-L-alanine amidase family protein [Clostridium sp. HBUAS56010]
MAKKQSSFHMGNEFNGYGETTYLKGTQCGIHPPLSQENVQLSPDFRNCLLKALGSVPVIIDPANSNPVLLSLLGSMTRMNQMIMSKDAATGNYVVQFNIISQNFADGAYPYYVELMDNKVPTAMGILNQWVPYGAPEGAKWKYYKDGHYIKSDWVFIDKDKAWYYLGSDEYMVTGWKEIRNHWYYFISKVVGGCEKDGHMALGWMKIKGLWYYLKEEESAGYMVTGWRKIQGKWYYFKTKAEAKHSNDYGYMFNNKWLKDKGKWYYFNHNGEMATSKLIDWGGKKYFLKKDGTMAVNETIVDPVSKKTYKADEDGVCREVKNGVIKIALSDSKRFVEITDGSKKYYGGNQAWYEWGNEGKTNVAKMGGCGTVASANIVAYLAAHNSKYAALYAFSDYTIENFLLHMEEMFEYVTPHHIKSQPLGVWPISVMEDGVEKFASDKEIELHAVRREGYYNRENIINYITEGLEKDSPVAMLIGTSGSSDVTIIEPDGSKYPGNSFKLHWVTITELEIDELNKKTKVKVSSWGGWGEVDLDNYIKNEPLKGLVYFE